MPDVATPIAQATGPGTDAWPELLDAAARHAAEREHGIAEHRPQVAVLSCSDARIPPSVVFGRPAGDLFVVRIAGNTAADTAVASLEYAVTVLEVPTLVVLGHTGCGAIAAALDGVCDGSLAPVVEPLCELASRTGCGDPSELSRLNVAATIDGLAAASPAIAEAIAGGRLAVHGAVYDLATGELDGVDPSIIAERQQPAGGSGSAATSSTHIPQPPNRRTTPWLPPSPVPNMSRSNRFER